MDGGAFAASRAGGVRPPEHPETRATYRDQSLNVDPLGKPLEYGEAVFASDRMELDIASTEEPPKDY